MAYAWNSCIIGGARSISLGATSRPAVRTGHRRRDIARHRMDTAGRRQSAADARRASYEQTPSQDVRRRPQPITGFSWSCARSNIIDP
jgi:hypothetical protein